MGTEAETLERTVRSDPRQALRAIQKGLLVTLIATDRSRLTTCGVNEELGIVVEKNRSNDFDYLPVTTSTVDGIGTRNQLIGLGIFCKT